MSKRQINKQQSLRIEKIQADFRLLDKNNNTDKGLVLKRFGRHAEVEDEAGKIFHCTIRPNIDSLVAGDEVVWQKTATNKGIVLSRFDRKTVLERPDNRGKIKPIASNITQIIVVIAPKPILSLPLLDSYLILAEYLKLDICIVLNKTDLACENIKKDLNDIYFGLGYNLLFLSKFESDGIDKLKEKLQNQTNIFVGQSGVGKSSIIASILPHERIITQEISASTELGCHTTSNACFYHLPSGGALIDSPGIRDFSLNQLEIKDFSWGYREFRQFQSECKFRNCNHNNTPQCGVIAAVKDGKISITRYENFIKLTNQILKK